MEIAFESRSRMPAGDLAFIVRAVNTQMIRDFAPAYDIEPWPCRANSDTSSLPAGTFYPITVMDDIATPGAVGMHDDFGGIIYGRVRVSDDPLDGVACSHEALELRNDPETNLWLPMGDGREIAYEACDAAESDRYQIHVTIGEETRQIWVSDFVLPAYFVQGAPPPYSLLDTIDEPFGLSRSGGGYRLIRNADMTVISDFGRHATVDAHQLARMRERVSTPTSRSYRRGLR